jgi:P-type Ca2+ transporter type 2C
MTYFNLKFSGLNEKDVSNSRAKYGWNRMDVRPKNRIVSFLKDFIHEPMLLLLLAASIIYFVHGDTAEGGFLAVAIILVSSISIYQESRSMKALDALKSMAQPKTKVIRDSEVIEIDGAELVVGDYIISEEGSLVAADGVIVQANDFSVNESVLTGESLPVAKNSTSDNNHVYQGTFVVSGLAIARVTQIGLQTKVGQIGKKLAELKTERTPMQVQIDSFVRKMAFAGVLIFLVIWGMSIYRTQNILDSLLKALTIAMSILPEEIPVAFATFMAIGAWRLMQLGIIVKQTKTVEALGSATLICVDKTGTITKNEMQLTKVYVHSDGKIYQRKDKEIKDVITAAMWASEPLPFDPMEKDIHELYSKIVDEDDRGNFKLVHEYPLSGKPPFMTHIFGDAKGQQVVAAKGAPEAFLGRSSLSDTEIAHIATALATLTRDGYRVLAVASAQAVKQYPASQEGFNFQFMGLIAFYDPPKENIKTVLRSLYNAGVDIKIITGDNPVTTSVISGQIDLRNKEAVITGEQLMDLDPETLSAAVRNTTIFARMFPEAKLKIIEELKRQKEVVAMTGDGINDGPALKAAHIGVAMGKKGSQIARQASSMILTDDNLERMVDAIAMGRRIYNNLKKAIQYIISIHIPIILIVFIPLMLGWVYPAVFTPVHVIFLELVMGPTCSIIYENEPIERNLMTQKPRPASDSFFNLKELTLSITQGLVITAGLVAIYWRSVGEGGNAEVTTAMVFITLITSNIALTLVNRSFYYSILDTFFYPNRLIPLIILTTIMIVVIVFSIPQLRGFFGFDIPSLKDILYSICVGFSSVIWFEGFKFFRRRSDKLKTGQST